MLGEEGNEEVLFNGYRVSVWDNEKALEMDNDYDSQHCECTSCHWIQHLRLVKMVNFIFSAFYHRKPRFLVANEKE